MKKLAIAAALALSPGVAALAADFSGSWNLAGAFDSLGMKYSSTCKLAQDAGGKLTGTCTGSQNEAAATTGSVMAGSGGKTNVEFVHDTTYQGSPVHLDYKGAAQPDGSLAGTVDSGSGVPGTFTATKGQQVALRLGRARCARPRSLTASPMRASSNAFCLATSPKPRLSPG